MAGKTPAAHCYNCKLAAVMFVMRQTQTSRRVGAHSWSKFMQQTAAKNVLQRVYRATLHTTVTLSLAELAALAMHDDLVSVLGLHAAVGSFLAATLRHVILAN